MKNKTSNLQRRNFLKLMGAVPAAGVAPAWAASGAVSLLDQSGAAPVKLAVAKLAAALKAHGGMLHVVTDIKQAKGLLIVVATPRSPLVANFPPAAAGWGAADSLRLAPGKVGSHPALLVSAMDARGFVYGLHELAERVEFGGLAALHLDAPVEESSPNRVRSVARPFLSEIEDKAWFYDREGWRAYLDMLVAARFNRFNFALGFGYDFPKGVTGDYLHFPYPYLIDVPGYDVTIAPPLAAGEQKKNLETLKFIARETGARGLEFQLGLWTHAWQWTDSPHSDHVIHGLDGADGKADWKRGAAYSRDAVAILLKECPEITGITLRVHGESGVPEGTYDFWQTLFEAFTNAGRKLEIEMHAKGINQIMIDMAVKTGQTVKVGPKFSAEHQSLGYHQADIRAFEIPTADRMEQGVFNVSNGERRFTRYGYADLYQEGRAYGILYRLWPGTQKHLLSADPAWASALGHAVNFCGADGVEFCEPLTFKGREGLGHPGGRNAYLGTDSAKDWRKFADSYRLWGRLVYNPDAAPDSWRRGLKRKFGDGADAAERALAAASRILPLVTSAHMPSASNHSLWYEMYTNQPIVSDKGFVPYTDTPAPRVFGNASALDPQLFSTCIEHVDDLVAGRPNVKYSPAEVAAWLEVLLSETDHGLTEIDPPRDVEMRRLVEDVAIQSGLGHFFAAKLRAGLYFALWQKVKSRDAGAHAVEAYSQARDAWAKMADRAKGVYAADVSYGSIPQRRGHWSDRLAAIDADLMAMKAAIAAEPGGDDGAALLPLIAQPPQRFAIQSHHIAPERFAPGADLPVTLDDADGASVRLFYRHVNHGERWRSMAMAQEGDSFRAAIPAAYTSSPYPLQYYFVLEKGTQAAQYPGFNATLSNQPYFAVWKRG
ncbi:MAG TPA: hypothetical protein VHZ32_03605 [Rhizomicrobium sp.]|jgi:hypothetical protein|nr:hypothetical protein [Rhizomicrobium sp.]